MMTFLKLIILYVFDQKSRPNNYSWKETIYPRREIVQIIFKDNIHLKGETVLKKIITNHLQS